MMRGKLFSLPLPNAEGIVRVRWKTRTAGFDAGKTKDVVRKAQAHFRLEEIREELLVLVTEINGEQIEVTDDILKRLPGGATVTLTKLPKCAESDDECTTLVSSSDTKPGTTGGTPVLPSAEGSILQPPVLPLPSSNPPPNVTPSAPLTPSMNFSARNGQPRKLRKPIVYLFPPQPIPHATVSVCLVPQWTFSHMYPLSEVKPLEDGRTTITWSVSASPDGTLIEKGSGLELSYLFWEAVARSGEPPSPPLDPIDGVHTEHFDPANPSLGPDTPTAVLLPFGKLLPYLDGVLKSLSLHTAARNDFITYWLPALSKQPYVALRFLPQSVYERAAEMEVRPTPDVVTRVMMLFRSVPAVEVGMWTAARERASRVDWTSVVGVKIEALDTSLFRVLEWGGMEVF